MSINRGEFDVRFVSFVTLFIFKAIRTYDYAIRCQNDWRNLHHVRRDDHHRTKLFDIDHCLDRLLGNPLVSCVSSFDNVSFHFIIDSIIIITDRLQRQWKQAIVMADILFKENNWSKATSCYLLATFQFEENHHVATDEIIQLYK